MANLSLDIPPAAEPGFEKLTDDEKLIFVSEYGRRRRSGFLMVVLAVVFPIQLFLLGRFWLGILFLITGGGFAIWYLIEWFLTPGRVRDYNSKMAMRLLAELPKGPVVAPESEIDVETPTMESDESEE